MLIQIGRGKRFPPFTLLIRVYQNCHIYGNRNGLNETFKTTVDHREKHLIEITTKWNSHNSLLLSKSKTIPRIEHNSTNPNTTLPRISSSSQNLKTVPELQRHFPESETSEYSESVWHGYFPISRVNIIHILHYIYFTISTQPHLLTKLFPVMLHIQILDVAYGISFLCGRFCCFEGNPEILQCNVNMQFCWKVWH